MPKDWTATRTCPHSPPCPPANAPGREAARTLVARPEQGWTLLCNGVVLFDDSGELLPDARQIAPHPTAIPCLTASLT